jgi:outer membrane receptor protein involved in Fe transport
VTSALLLCLMLTAPAPAQISGVVRDASGAVVPGASVIVRSAAGGEQRTTAGPDGRFALDASMSGDLTLIVRAIGFAEKSQPIRDAERGSDLVILLAPATLLQEVTVTASRTEQRLGDVPASVSVLRSEEIRQSPAVVADDVLRQIPTFSLFRRSSSLSSNPTTQGVSLRGVGPSGVSRTLVLLDGIPFNDPFGGWVYWTRVPLESVDSVEVVDGSSSSLYGNYAMGGVINIVTSHPARRTLELKPQYGSRNSPKLDFLGSDVWRNVGVVVDGSVFDTDGYPTVAASERGRIDNNATVNFRNVNAKLDYNPTGALNVFVRTGYFREIRDNGKFSTIDGTEESNDTTWKSASGGVRMHLPDHSDLQARVFTDFETFHSNFLAVPTANPPRSIGRMTLNQSVPITGVGGMVEWTRALGTRSYLTAGTDARWVDGDSDEDALDAVTGTKVTLRRVSGGTQRLVGAFVQDLLTPLPKLEVTLSARVDHWRNYNAHNLETTVATGLPTANNRLLPDRDDTVGSPRAGVLYHFTDRVTAWGDVGAGFRAPTLNELYRQFRVGTVLTLPNAGLGPERLVGGEAGINVAPARNVTWRTTWFDNRFTNPVSNVTLSTVGGQITRQRQNLGSTRIQGVQSDVEYRAGSWWRVSGGYLYDQADVREFPADPTLVGNLLPQVPRHRGTVQIAYTNPRYATVAVQSLFAGRQFDDDQNKLPLPGYTVTDFLATRALTRNFDVYFGVQNVFDRVVIVGTGPTAIGAPRLVNGGVRVRFSAR